jgi:CBS domain-containing protein
MRVEHLMTKDVCTCRPSTSLNEAAQMLWEADCGLGPVVDEDGSGRVVGVLTDRDVCMAAYTQGRSLCELRVDHAMAHEVVSCAPTDDLETAAGQMREARVRRLAVVDDARQLLGVLSLSDVARHAATQGGITALAEVGRTLAAITQPRSPSAG